MFVAILARSLPPAPRVINVDKNAAYPKAIAELNHLFAWSGEDWLFSSVCSPRRIK
jgi:hypothetical protein